MAGAKIKELLGSFQDGILKGVEERLKSVTGAVQHQVQDNTPTYEIFDDVVPTYCDGKYLAFCYAVDGSTDRKFWMLPKKFEFAKCNRKVGWSYWMLGLPNYVEEQPDGSMKAHPIMPFRLLDPSFLPKNLRSALRVTWHPVFKIMDEAIVSGNSHPTEMSTEELETWWEAGDKLLQTRVAYCYVNPRHHSWSVGTWSTACAASTIRKKGTPEDILALPPVKNGMTWTAGARNSRKKRNRNPKPITRHFRRSVRAVSATDLLSTLADATNTATPAAIVTAPKTPTRRADSNDDDSYEPITPPSPFDPEDIEAMECFDSAKW